MNSRRILEKLLQSGQSMLDKSSGSTSGRRPSSGQSGGLDWKKIGSAALSGGALASLMGSRRRGIGGRISRLSSMAALAGIAYRAYGEWQRQKQGQPGSFQSFDQLPPAEAERHSQAVLQAIIAAAKADGHIDDLEREMIERQLANDPNDRELQQWLNQELRKPLDPREIARAAQTPELAAEIYTASLAIADERNAREQQYLDELARHMQIPPDLKATLEREVRQA